MILLFFISAEEGEGEFYFDEDEVLGGLDEEARAAHLARQAAGMDLEEAEGELGEVSQELWGSGLAYVDALSMDITF